MMKTKLTLPKGCSKYGAQMGRNNQLPSNTNEPVKLRLTRLPFVDQCYDRWGAYWGSPANVWCAWGDATDYAVRVFVRADDRETAKNKVREELPNAKFFR